MKKWLKRIGLIALFLIGVGISYVLLFSRYTNKTERGYKTVEYSVEIDTAVQVVFDYLGNSANAVNWSSYVDHITPLNANEFRDGALGSTRRCYKNENEEGILWDEEVLEIEPNQKRVLSIYNMQGFWSPIEGLKTEQLYELISDNKMRLTFTLFFANHNSGLWEGFKMHLASFTVYNRFRDNLENVKKIVEQ
jgi:uncharacterized protein YndB with AHSA1/START domain